MYSNFMILYNNSILLFISMSFPTNIINFCKPLSVLDLPTLRQGSRAKRTQRTHIYIYVCVYVYVYDMTNFISSREKLHCNAQELHTIHK